MHESITVGMVVWTLLSVGVIGFLLCIIFTILTAIGDGFKH